MDRMNQRVLRVVFSIGLGKQMPN